MSAAIVIWSYCIITPAVRLGPVLETMQIISKSSIKISFASHVSNLYFRKNVGQYDLHLIFDDPRRDFCRLFNFWEHRFLIIHFKIAGRSALHVFCNKQNSQKHGKIEDENAQNLRSPPTSNDSLLKPAFSSVGVSFGSCKFERTWDNLVLWPLVWWGVFPEQAAIPCLKLALSWDRLRARLSWDRVWFVRFNVSLHSLWLLLMCVLKSAFRGNFLLQALHS